MFARRGGGAGGGGGGVVEHGSLNFNCKDKAIWFMHPVISLFINFCIPNH